ncbi:S-layer homology domain-containing protein [Thermoanaerobacterium sp. DL9XJH110]|uniref:S-layer homology domain-containing protein n=1 Tax=Thermoanaerobacterium sp. DL9XJH110 TaxID=3386643 RepID=UPI003BB4B029
MRKAFTILMAFILLFGLLPAGGARAQGTNFEMTGPEEVKIGDTFNVVIDGRDIESLYGFEVTLTYDTDKLRLKDVKTELPDAGRGFDLKKEEGNTVIYAFTKIGDVALSSGDMTLCTFVFEAKGAGRAQISLGKVEVAYLKAGDDVGSDTFTVNKSLSVDVLSEQPHEQPPVRVTGVRLDTSSLTLKVGQTRTLKATVYPEDAADKRVTWKSSNSAVASVGAGGLVTARAAGTAVITVTTVDGNKTDTCNVTVTEDGGESSGGGSGESGKNGTSAPGQTVSNTEDTADISELLQISKSSGAGGVTKVDVHVGFDAVKQALENAQVKNIQLAIDEPADETNVILPAQSVQLMSAKNVTLTLKNDKVELAIPVKEMSVEKFASQLGTGLLDMQFSIAVRLVPGGGAEELLARARRTEDSLNPIGKVLDISIRAEAGGKSVSVADFSNQAIKGYFKYSGSEAAKIRDIRKVNVYRYNQETGQWEYRRSKAVPAGGMVEFYTGSLSFYTVMENDKTFEDIQGHWARESIELMAAKYIVKGMTGGKFMPEGRVTRAQFATMLVNALGLRAGESGSTRFSDVAPGAWYYDGIMAAAGAGLVNGVGDGRFAPDAGITREQMAVMIIRAYGYITGKDCRSLASGAVQFKDVDRISPWAKQAVMAANKLGIVTGLTPQRFEPLRNATRAQAAVMVYRLLTGTGLL